MEKLMRRLSGEWRYVIHRGSDKKQDSEIRIMEISILPRNVIKVEGRIKVRSKRPFSGTGFIDRKRRVIVYSYEVMDDGAVEHGIATLYLNGRANKSSGRAPSQLPEKMYGCYFATDGRREWGRMDVFFC